MLKAVIIQDFFSFKGKTEIKLNDRVNLLLGINGSGKSSFINSLRILTEGIVGEGLVKLIQEQWGGYEEIINCNGEQKAPYAQITYIFDYKKLNTINTMADFKSDVYYRITIRQSGTSYTLNEEMYTENKKRTGLPFTYLDFSNGNGKMSTQTQDSTILFQDYSDSDISGQELILRQINDPKHYLPIHTLRKAIESISVYSNFNVEEGSRVRSTTEFSTDIRLRKNGSNLSQILNLLKLKHSFDFDRLENTFKNINPNFKSIEISNIYGQSYLSLLEKNMSRAIGALHISDGTLRFLLLESIFYNPLQGNLVAIDEPEKGLHPDMIRSVAEMIKHASQKTQLIIATHSPHLLNQFELEDILVFEKDENNTTIVKNITEEDFPDWEGDYLPGQMWLLGQIGGKRW
ncbi:MAG: AAA family ATPase [Bacteroidales bacterium]|nr:AAA family ATPase [Bacteroidales bacterium]